MAVLCGKYWRPQRDDDDSINSETYKKVRHFSIPQTSVCFCEQVSNLPSGRRVSKHEHTKRRGCCRSRLLHISRLSTSNRRATFAMEAFGPKRGWGMERLQGLLGVALLVGAILWWLSGPSNDEFVSYWAQCTNNVKILPLNRERDRASRDKCEILPMHKTVYKLNPARGEIYYKLPFTGAQRLLNCAIIDNDNWTCSYPNSNEKVVVIDGLRTFTPTAIIPGFYMRRWQWWIATALTMIGKKPRGSWLIPDQEEAM